MKGSGKHDDEAPPTYTQKQYANMREMFNGRFAKAHNVGWRTGYQIGLLHGSLWSEDSTAMGGAGKAGAQDPTTKNDHSTCSPTPTLVPGILASIRQLVILLIGINKIDKRTPEEAMRMPAEPPNEWPCCFECFEHFVPVLNARHECPQCPADTCSSKCLQKHIANCELSFHTVVDNSGSGAPPQLIGINSDKRVCIWS
jgi:hypothetical protein